MKISGRGVISLQLDDTGREVLKAAGLEAEEALAATIVDEDDRGLWMRINRQGARYWLLIRWPFIRSVEIPAAPPRERGNFGGR